MSLVKHVISTVKAPAAIGPYSQAILVDKTLYISGSLGLNPRTGELISDKVEDQTEQSLKNIGEILKPANCSFSNVVKTTVLLADMKDFSIVNKVYAKFFEDKFPARAAYQVAALPKDGKVEIEAIAVLDNSSA